MLRQSLPLLFVLAPVAVHAQLQSPPTAPLVIASGAQIQLPVPPNADKPRLQILLVGSNTVLDDERASVQNGVATARLEADPGTYDVRVVANDKTRTPLGVARRFQIPGFKREAGRWLFNGSAVAYQGTNPPTLSLVLPNLKRGTKTKLPSSVTTPVPVKWDLQSFGAEFSTQTAGSRLVTADAATIKANFQQQQAALTASNPKGALLLSEKYTADSLAQAAYIDSLSPLVEGVVCDMPTGSSLAPNWLLKVARRNVEETANFDLPLFARFADSPSDYQMLRAFQDGASNLIVPDGTTSPFLEALTRQSARFAGAVTIEDAGLQIKDFAHFAPILRRAGRVPLLARLPGDGNGADKDNDKNAESLIIAFDASTDAAMLDKIDRAARRGATIYCEGSLPPALFTKWGEITKTVVTALPAPKTSTVSLSDPWFWGTINEQNFDVTQNLMVKVKASMASQTNDVKGEARETIARPLARFNDDPNAIMLCPTGKGRILWAPFDVSTVDPYGPDSPLLAGGAIFSPSLNSNVVLDSKMTPAETARVAAQMSPTPTGPVKKLAPSYERDYYAAIAGAMQASLVSYTATKGSTSGVSVALRAIPAEANNPKSSAVSLIAFFNASESPVELDARVRGDGAYTLDLMTNQAVPSKVRDFATKMALQIPAKGFRWIAVAKDERAWNDAAKNGVRAQLK